MGCFNSKDGDDGRLGHADGDPSNKERRQQMQYAKPKWRAQDPVTNEQLQAMRAMFWDTQPHYGGDSVIWDNIKAAVAADAETCSIILEAAGIIVASPDMTVMYDERGAKYDLPHYVLCDPINVAPTPAAQAE